MDVTDPSELDLAMATAEAAEAEQKKTSSDVTGVSDVLEGAGDIAFSGVGEIIGEGIGAAVEVTGAIVSGTFDIAGSILGGIFEA